MKTLEEYMKMPYKLEIIPDTEEDGYVASYPELPGCITCGSTISDAINNAEDAKQQWLLAAIEDNVDIIEPKIDTSVSYQFGINIPRSLLKSLKEDSRKEGVTLNQYCLYLLSKNSEIRRSAI
ncbi:MAG: type II toxin-antitoxin system HicB family antitoxin [Bacteroidales bacterium]|nr:type II toxin-antitoxin system HicB family antitoxin [Bacteroidales bacterium]